MAERKEMTTAELEELLLRARNIKSPASLRMRGSARMLGQLQVRGLEPGVAIQLGGAKYRDLLPAPGTEATLTFLMDDLVLAIPTTLLEPLAAAEAGRQQNPRVLRAAWPTGPLEVHHRDDVRVATPDLPPLAATLETQGSPVPAMLLNLTETGIGLGLEQPLEPAPHGEVVVATALPGGVSLRLVGEVRHCELLPEGPLPFRIGLVLRDLQGETREALRGMIQARRIIRSESLRDQ
jgi:hypothetical protein